MDVPAFQNNEKRQTTGAFLSSLSIICRFSISGALPQLFLPFNISGALPQLFLSLPFLGQFNSCQKI
jgi:hypothetical protein